MKRILVLGGVLVVALFLIAYLASPVLAARDLVDAAREGDAPRLERRVDFPAFRASLKDELNAELMTEMRRDLGRHGGALAGFGALLAPSLVSGAVDALVTPSSVAAMVRNAQAPKPSDAGKPVQPPADRREGDKVRQSYGYRNLDTFVVTLTQADRPNQTLDLLMTRHGLFDWQLSGIDLSRDDTNP